MTKHPISMLRPAPYNPRTMSDKNADALRVSMVRFGDISGLTFNQKTGNMVSGHQRLERLVEMGAELIEDEAGMRVVSGGLVFPVRVVEWDEETEIAANIAANNPHIAGEFNERLQPLLGRVEDSFGPDVMHDLRLEPLRENVEEVGLPDIDDEEEPELSQMAFILNRSQKEIVERALQKSKSAMGSYDGNVNGFALAYICNRFNNG